MKNASIAVGRWGAGVCFCGCGVAGSYISFFAFFLFSFFAEGRRWDQRSAVSGGIPRKGPAVRNRKPETRVASSGSGGLLHLVEFALIFVSCRHLKPPALSLFLSEEN